MRTVTAMSSKATLKSFKNMMAGARLPERSVPICLRGDLAADHEAAERELKEAQKQAADSLAGNGTGEIAERIQALEAEMKDSIYDFRLRALSAPKFRAFKTEHPSRIGDDGQVQKEDAVFGFNTETGFEPLLRLCVVDPELDDESWTQLMDTLTENQFDELAGAAWFLNRGGVDIPFSSSASELMRASVSE
jgi:hypothetical protein